MSSWQSAKNQKAKDSEALQVYSVTEMS
jgi:hypothetical protein